MRDVENGSVARISAVLTKSKTLGKAVPFVTELFTLVGKRVLYTIEAVLQKVLTENKFNDRSRHTTSTFKRSRYIVRGYVTTLKDYDQLRCCNT